MFDSIAENDQDPDPLSKILNDSECRVEVFREDVSSILSENMTEDAIIFSTVNDIDDQSIGSLKVSNVLILNTRSITAVYFIK